ncbi:MAG: hypothetical protein IJ106_13110 [Parasporobacterium sp.]|nr:hypothetical protein [Parasporobacterium sp.]
MKRFLCGMFTVIMCLGMLAGALTAIAAESETEEKDYARLIQEIPADADVETAIKIEKRNNKHIIAMQVLFDADSYKAYNKAVSTMKKEETMEAVQAAVEAREALVEVESVADRIWFIWNEDMMPCVDGEEYTEEDLDASQMFGYGYEPIAIKYLVEDQSACKGNIIACSGGAMKVWANNAEGYPAAQVFNDLGYNFFLLQRRVEPYSNEDIFMDYQRLIRLVKYHAKEEGYGGQDMFAGVGWSGGSFTLLGSINYFYGDVTPADYDSDYVPDEIDAINADLDVAMAIYGGSYDPEGGNTNLPCFYICQGTEDSTVDPQGSYDLYDAVTALGVPAELNMIEGAEHGFGVGLSPATGQAPGTEEWPMHADEFMQAHLGYQTDRY